MRFSIGLACAVAFAASLSSTTASAVETGVLECNGKSTSYILGSVTELECVFRPSIGGRNHAYSATIRRFGVDVGFNQSTKLAWAVFAPTRRIGEGSLGGLYLGASANATVGVGVGANALFGAADNSIALQPISVQGQTGLGAAGGISGLELRPEMRPKHRHRR
jgi:hypothetical protein